MRKGLGDQAKEKATPDSQKSTLDQTKESVTGLGDKAAAAVQPSDSKSNTQKAGDSLRGGSDDAQNEVRYIPYSHQLYKSLELTTT
jgi:hypothetical protein